MADKLERTVKGRGFDPEPGAVPESAPAEADELRTPEAWAKAHGHLITDRLDGAVQWGPRAGASAALHGWRYDLDPYGVPQLIAEQDYLAALEAPGKGDKRGEPQPHGPARRIP